VKLSIFMLRAVALGVLCLEKRLS